MKEFLCGYELHAVEAVEYQDLLGVQVQDG